MKALNTPIEIVYTPQDYTQASALHWRHTFLGFRFLRSLIIVGAIAAVVYGAIAYEADATPQMVVLISILAFFGAMAVLATMSVLSRLFYLPYLTRRLFRQAKEYQEPWHFAVEDDYFVMENRRGKATLPYSDFVKWAANAQTFLVYRTSRQFNLIPTRFIPPDVYARLIERLASAGVPKAAFRNS